MRSTRALIAGTALVASLTLGAPAAAFAADVSDPGGHGGYSSGQESEDYGSGGSWKEKESKGKEESDFGKGKEEESGFGKGKEEESGFGKGKEEESDFGKGKEEESGYGKDDYSKGSYGSKEEEKGGYGKEEHGWGGSSSYGKEREHEKPHGGVHTGGGGMATTGGGMAAGSVLLLGGLGAGAYALRRRKPTGTAI
ncbi:hypothetical protein B7755_036275 [Streptomyces sp. NBS 14/10]|uniref:hypothetical protein n=1 Tax=Streptomyces sp. NBS 14/10 TaxID=1945643 RepID=UPI000B7F07CA|nr:hypothetical protein [Streptomyces sp. NBS 14/10]KAK1183113.1 hypothetical protein B7755_036275 [Streptomyces sp. NBS 14/10]NUP45103.1 hypothetical protein [Streptomyces sp.]NUS86952.1 hypothetical protein [Streptomyces sp.]